MIDLTKDNEQLLTGNDSIVIRKYIDGIEGGRALDLTDYLKVSGASSVLQAGHVIITKDGEYKPLPLATGAAAYDALPDGWSYAGILAASINAQRDGAAILTRGKVNASDAAQPFSYASILTALKAALPLVEFVEDGK